MGDEYDDLLQKISKNDSLNHDDSVSRIAHLRHHDAEHHFLGFAWTIYVYHF